MASSTNIPALELVQPSTENGEVLYLSGHKIVIRYAGQDTTTSVLSKIKTILFGGLNDQ